MGYALHIRRPDAPLPLEEWVAFGRARKELYEEGTVEWAGLGSVPVFGFGDCTLVWFQDQVTVDHLESAWCTQLAELADALGAQAIGDDGERYFADGRIDYGDGPRTPEQVNELFAERERQQRAEEPWYLRWLPRNTLGLVIVGVLGVGLILIGGGALWIAALSRFPAATFVVSIAVGVPVLLWNAVNRLRRR